MSGQTYSGEGQALIVGNNCSVIKSFYSSYKWSMSPDATNSDFAIIDYENSILGKKRLSAVYTYQVFDAYFYQTWQEISSDGSLNFVALYFYDADYDFFYVIVNITGIHKKCNYSSTELDYLVVDTLSAAAKENFKKQCGTTADLHKILESNSDLKKKYGILKTKMGLK